MSPFFDVIPLVGIKFDEGNIRLNDTKGEVELVLGQPCRKTSALGGVESYYYFDCELRIDFNSFGLVEFIEFLGGVAGQMVPRIYGVDAFRETVDVLYAVLSEKNCGTVLDTEESHSYMFLNIGVGVYREIVPEDVRRMLEDAEREGYTLDSTDIIYESERSRHFDTLGIGGADYYTKA